MKYDILDSRTKSMQDLGCCLHPKTTKMFGQERIQSFQPFPLVNLPFMCRENKVFFRPNISGPIWSCLSKIKQYIDIKELCVLCNVTATMITLSGSPTDLYLDVRSKWVEEPDYGSMTKASGFPTTQSEQAKPSQGEGRGDVVLLGTQQGILPGTRAGSRWQAQLQPFLTPLFSRIAVYSLDTWWKGGIRVN